MLTTQARARACRQGLEDGSLCDIVQPTWVKVNRVDAPCFWSSGWCGRSVSPQHKRLEKSRGEKCAIKAAQRPPTRPSRPRTQTRVLLARLRPTAQGSTAFHRWSPEAIRFGSSYGDSRREFDQHRSTDAQTARVDFTLTVGSSAQATEVVGTGQLRAAKR